MKYSYLVLILLFISCSHNKAPKVVKLLGEVQGTYYSIIYYDGEGRDFQVQIDSILHDFDLSVSLWVSESILCRVNKGDHSTDLDQYFLDNFNISTQVAQETDGAFDFTIGSLAKAWGFGANGVKHVDTAIIDSLRALVGYTKVSIKNGRVEKDDARTSFDFNAVAQGYSVDVVGDFLSSQGIMNYLIDIGGEIKGRGGKPDGKRWAVGIEKPAADKNSERVLSAIIELENASIATSGNYRKYFEEDGVRYSHTIDPKTGYPARQTLLSATILSDSTAFADAYATACMVMGLEKSLEFVNHKPKLEGFFIYSTDEGYSYTATEGFKSRVTDWFDDQN